ncbi:MAG: hypothetical protein Kow0098_09360 [Ignavibacteriaceae bacterium]
MRAAIYFILILILFAGCGDKFDINQVVNQNSGSGNITGDTLYVRLNPDWTGFNKPQDVMIGKEPFVYVADTENDRIVMMNLDGRILGTKAVKHPVAIAQDFQLNLIVCAQFDTVVNQLTQTYSAVYKIDLFIVQHQLEIAPMKRLLPVSASDLNNPDREYTGVAVFYDNTFVIARRGPHNSSLSDPDNAFLSFGKIVNPDGSKTDTLLGRISGFDPLGAGVPSANGLSSVTSFNETNYDIIITLIGGTAFKSQWFEYIDSREFTGYTTALQPSESEFMTPNRFVQPEDAAIDNIGNVYIADAGKDSVFKFNSFGDELQSFGGPEVFNKPYAVAHFDKVLYVADTENNRILRFILSTDQ